MICGSPKAANPCPACPSLPPPSQISPTPEPERAAELAAQRQSICQDVKIAMGGAMSGPLEACMLQGAGHGEAAHECVLYKLARLLLITQAMHTCAQLQAMLWLPLTLPLPQCSSRRGLASRRSDSRGAHRGGARLPLRCHHRHHSHLHPGSRHQPARTPRHPAQPAPGAHGRVVHCCSRDAGVAQQAAAAQRALRLHSIPTSPHPCWSPLSVFPRALVGSPTRCPQMVAHACLL